MNSPSIPQLAEFLALSHEEVARVAPATLIFAPGGTRRAAALAGLDPHSDAYAAWSHQRMILCLERLFRHGVRHIFVVVLRPAQLAEVGPYRERLLGWLVAGLAGPAAQADYARLGWRARIVGALGEPVLAEVAATLAGLPGRDGAPTVWFVMTTSAQAHFALLQQTLRDPAVGSRAEAARAVYGEDLPPAELLLSFGKPLIGDDIVPAFLGDEIQCYWSQRPGFELDDETLRRIFYDYAYLRRTWRADKAERYGQIVDQRGLWERTPALVLGVGQQLAGGLWYPGEEG